MKRLSLLFIFSIITLNCLAQTGYRNFSNSSGKQIEAKVMGADDTVVKLRRKDGRKFDAPISMFSNEDQEFIKRWIEKDMISSLKLEVSIRSKKGKARKEESYSSKIEIWPAFYEVEIKNKGRTHIDDLSIRYIAYMFDAKAGGTKRNSGKENRLDGTHEVEYIYAGKSATFQTKPFSMSKSKLKGGWYYGSGGKNKSQDGLAGIWVRIYRSEDLLVDYKNPKGLDKGQWHHSGNTGN